MSIIRTSYYYKVRNKAEDYYKVAISLTAPTGEYDRHAVLLAPTQDMLWYYKNNLISEAEYTRMYKEILDKLKSDGALSGFVEDFKEHDKVLLLCYEGKYKFCHRHILSEYLNKHYGLNITEL